MNRTSYNSLLGSLISATGGAVFGMIAGGMLFDPQFRDWNGYVVGGICAAVFLGLVYFAVVPSIVMTDEAVSIATALGRRTIPWPEVASVELDRWTMGGRSSVVFIRSNGRKVRPAKLLTITGNKALLEEVVADATRRMARYRGELFPPNDDDQR